MYLDALDPDLASSGGSNLARGARPGRAAPRRHHRCGGPRARALHRRRGARHAARDRRAGRGAQGRRRQADRGGGGQARAGAHPDPRLGGHARSSTSRTPTAPVVRTQRRDDILGAMVEAAEGTLVPNEVPDQAGAVRDLVAAMKRSPTSETRTADLVPRAWIPVLVAALLLALYTHRSPGAGTGRPRGPARRRHRAVRSARPKATRALAAGDPAGRGRGFPRRGGQGQRRATPPSTTRAPRPWRPGGSMSRAARSPRRRSRSTPRSATARSTISVSSTSSPPRPTPPGRRSSWTTRWTGCARRCCCSRRPSGPSGTSSWPTGAVRRRRAAVVAAAAERRHRPAAAASQQQRQGETPQPGSVAEPGGADPQLDGAARAGDPRRAAAPAPGGSAGGVKDW